jgi:large subunit ribosomal protein L21
MYAFIKHSGKQFRVSEGEYILVDRLGDLQAGATVSIEDIVLSVDDKGATSISPSGKVLCEVVSHERSRKKLIFKHRRKKGYRRQKSTRAHSTRLQVKKIELAGSSS